MNLSNNRSKRLGLAPRSGRSAVRVVVFCAALPFASAVAAPAPSALPTMTPESIARETLLDAIAPALAVRGATAIVTVASLDTRRVLAPCNQFAGFMPPGARLAGRTLVGVRCVDGASWQTFLSADVRVEASTWQSTRALHAGEPIGNGDVALASAILTASDMEAAASLARSGRAALGQGAVGSRALASLDGRSPAPIGRIVQRPVAMGRPLTASDVRDEGRINPGDPVRVIYQGEGFAVSSEGRAVGAADPGATLSIRLASGALVNGTLRADHLVELPR